MVTDGCVTGVAGVISQGKDWHTAKVTAFYSAKLNSAQQNYPVHEIEMLAGVETMLRHCDILQGAKFRWYTNHKGLVTLLEQKNLSGRQARWLEKISEFDFSVVYVPSAENILSDALSRIYSQDEPGTVRARSEYIYHDIINNDALGDHLISMPLLVGKEGKSTVLLDSSEGNPMVMERGPEPGHKNADDVDQHEKLTPDNHEAQRVQKEEHQRRKRLVPVSTGRLETSREFAAWMTHGFVLKGPQQ